MVKNTSSDDEEYLLNHDQEIDSNVNAQGALEMVTRSNVQQTTEIIDDNKQK